LKLSIEGAVTALTNGSADYFMWERFMTQPLVDRGIFRRLADCPTPWPCFVIAARSEVLEQHPKLIHNLLQTINRETAKFKQISGIEEILAQRFGQKTRFARVALAYRMVRSTAYRGNVKQSPKSTFATRPYR
jgi:ABC-type nitrate/sulfonate/bicarbonate transport system substrate-binding protein